MTIDEVRNILNIPEASELADDVISTAISRAESYVADLESHTTASSIIISLAKTNYAAYLAYLSYADRVYNNLPGAFEQDGTWNPIADTIMRETRTKLQSLKTVADTYIKIIIESRAGIDVTKVSKIEDTKARFDF